jgi:hypothetical protein
MKSVPPLCPELPDRVVDTPTTEDRIVSGVVRFHPKNVTIAQYEDVLRREQASGAEFPPHGRNYHICFGTDGDLQVSEIWDSREQFQAYGQVLMPILADVGVEFAGEPEVFEIHNIIKR